MTGLLILNVILSAGIVGMLASAIGADRRAHVGSKSRAPRSAPVTPPAALLLVASAE